MKPRVTIFTTGVDDLERSLRFYREGLDLPTEGIVVAEFEYGAVVFIELQSGLRLALWPRKCIANDTGHLLQAKSATELTLGHNVNSKFEVDSLMMQAELASAVILKPAHDTFCGYSGDFQDSVGHAWEVAWNPELSVQD
jgi:hypothetical protein